VSVTTKTRCSQVGAVQASGCRLGRPKPWRRFLVAGSLLLGGFFFRGDWHAHRAVQYSIRGAMAVSLPIEVSAAARRRLQQQGRRKLNLQLIDCARVAWLYGLADGWFQTLL